VSDAPRGEAHRPNAARADVVRRNTTLLALSQGFAQVAFPLMLVVGGVAAADLTGRDGATGVVWALYFSSAASTSRETQASHEEPPQALLIRPMGTSMV
jgi:hypothetical protein